MKIIQFLLLLAVCLNTNLCAQEEWNNCVKYQSFDIAVLGSSTALGIGPVYHVESWTIRYDKYIRSINPADRIINLAQEEYTSYEILPTGSNVPMNRPSPNPMFNLSKAIELGVDGVIINVSYEDALNNYSSKEIKNNLDLLVTSAAEAGVKIWLCTPHPAANLDFVQTNLQKEIRDYILSNHELIAIDFWTDLASSDGAIIKEYDQGDGFHLNNLGHAKLFEKVKNKSLLLNLFEPYEESEFAISKYTMNVDRFCDDQKIVLQQTVINLGADFIGAVEVGTYQTRNGNTQILGPDYLNGPFQTCQEKVFTIDYYLLGDDYIFVGAVFNEDQNPSNQLSDTIYANLVDGPNLTAEDLILCEGEKPILTASSSNTEYFFWYENPLQEIPFAEGPMIEFDLNAPSGVYYVQAVRGDLYYKEALDLGFYYNEKVNGLMFDLTANDTLVIDSFLMKFAEPGTQTINAYYKEGTYKDFENDPSVWLSLGSTSIQVDKAWTDHHLSFDSLKMNKDDKVAIYLQCSEENNGFAFVKESSQKNYSLPQLNLQTGAGIEQPFKGIHANADWPGQIMFHHGTNYAGDCASFKEDVAIIPSELPPFVDLGEDFTIDLDQTINLYADISLNNIHWNGVPGGTTFTLNAADYGIGQHLIEIEAMNADSCSVMGEVTISIIEPLSLQSIKPIDFEVSPNPNKGRFKINFKNPAKRSIKLSDAQGNMMLRLETNADTYFLEKQLNPGLYMIEISDGNKSQVQKIIVF